MFNPRKNPFFGVPGPWKSACLGLDREGRMMTLCCQSPYQHCAKSRGCCQQGLSPDQLPAKLQTWSQIELYWRTETHNLQPSMNKADVQNTQYAPNLRWWPWNFLSRLLIHQQLKGASDSFDLVWTRTSVIFLCGFKGKRSNFYQCQM